MNELDADIRCSQRLDSILTSVQTSALFHKDGQAPRLDTKGCPNKKSPVFPIFDWSVEKLVDIFA